MDPTDTRNEVSRDTSESDATTRPLVYGSWILRNLPALISKQRALAYASEVGESFRPIIPKAIVNTSYALSLGYVGADIWSHTNKLRDANAPNKEIALQTVDKLIWHSAASMVLPAVSIHTIVKYTGKGVNTIGLCNKIPRVKAWFPTAVGLATVPFIIHPIDHLTDYVMDRTVRKLYKAADAGAATD